ncbi:formate dehydrogenase accessory protein FdhE [Bordetella genomosp. 9]|uniref:Protein FdhE homolog n=1 Tax=Bordetella genomosp. 9 TaxID=1416803 RepID=A0A261R3U8_9BORD|nr:formate dehydrogenase accessory protein FdhE [Bordetella genomosp. 9]OZI19699.1 formate dehydrogenase accessory protein FdhE [Bordetella genomosp. 9]
MQRILQRGEIEALDHNALPRLRLPARESVFRDRAARLRQLAADSPVGDYLLLMAHLADAQHRVLAGLGAADAAAAVASGERIDLAQAHGMPPLQAVGWPRDPAWRKVLRTLLDEVARSPEAPPQAVETCQATLATLEEFPEGIEQWADNLLNESEEQIDAAAAPFVMGALQVVWTDMAVRFDAAQLPVVSPFGVCPLCGSLPVASVVRVGGQYQGYRYLCCSLCATEWHMVRVKCTQCESTEGIAYHAIDGGSEAIKAESCDKCRTYRKIFYQEKDMNVEPVADDLASLMLDVLMGEADYGRASGNPLLWQEEA